MQVKIHSFNELVKFCKVGVQKEFDSNGCKSEDRLRNGRLEADDSQTQIVDYVEGWAVCGKPENVKYFIELFPKVDKAWRKADGYPEKVIPTIADDSFIV